MTAIQFTMPDIRLLAVAMILALAAYSTQSLAAYEFVTTFGSTGTASGQFDAPRGVAVNHQGKIIITESGNHRVSVCDDQGSCTKFGSFGELSGEFDKPRGVAVNSVDRLFIADRGNDRIASCASTGSCTDFGGSGTVVGKFESPRGIAIDAADINYITDTDNNRIQICTAAGACTAFGGLGTVLGKFNSPAGIGVTSSGKIVIADRGNDRIQVCTSMGSCTAFGTFGSGLGQFDGPAGIAIDSLDRIIIVDRFNDRIQICTEQGSCTAFGSFGSGQGQFNAPWGVAVDGEDRIIVADLGNDRIQIFADSSVSPGLTEMNAGLNDAWWNPVTDGQGFFITIFPEFGLVLASWFTYDTVPPADGVTAQLGAPDQRWFNAIGEYSGNQAVLDISMATGGLFDIPAEQQPVSRFDDGSILLTFTGCNTGTVEYNIPSIGQTGTVAIERIVPDNISLCESIEEQAVAQQSDNKLDMDSSIQSSGTQVAAVELAPLLDMNPGLNDAWWNPVTDGQGFFITVFPEFGLVLASWFTYDTEPPADGVTAQLGAPDQRWFNAIGEYSGNQAVLDISMATGGLFDTPVAQQPVSRFDDGSIILTFSDCNTGTVEYNIPSIGQMGTVPIERIVPDNIVLCESLSE